MAADDRLKVIARHLGARKKNVFQTSVATHLCSSENNSLEPVNGDVALPIGPPSDARNPRRKTVDSVIPKNRYEFLPYLWSVAQYSCTLYLPLLLRHSAIQFYVSWVGD
jgi:hypothetical protein